MPKVTKVPVDLSVVKKVTMLTRSIVDLPMKRALSPFSGRAGKLRKHVVAQFEDISELAKLCDVPGWYGHYQRETSNSWAGGSLDEARSWATEGWIDGGTKAREAAERIAVARPEVMRGKRYSVAGALPNIPRYLTGNPAHMELPAPKKQHGKVITLIASPFISCTIDPERLLAQAIAACAIVDALETAGYRCEVIARSMSTSETCVADVSVVAKRAGEALNVARMAFTIGHPSAIRRLWFGYLAGNDAFKDLGTGLGTPLATDESEAAEMNAFVIPTVQMTEGVSESETDPLVVFDALVEALAAQGLTELKG